MGELNKEFSQVSLEHRQWISAALDNAATTQELEALFDALAKNTALREYWSYRVSVSAVSQATNSQSAHAMSAFVAADLGSDDVLARRFSAAMAAEPEHSAGDGRDVPDHAASETAVANGQHTPAYATNEGAVLTGHSGWLSRFGVAGALAATVAVAVFFGFGGLPEPGAEATQLVDSASAPRSFEGVSNATREQGLRTVGSTGTAGAPSTFDAVDRKVLNDLERTHIDALMVHHTHQRAVNNDLSVLPFVKVAAYEAP